MSRVLRRPMFRMGGSTNEGITSGLGTPRQNYSNAGSVNQFEINRLNQNADKIKDAAMSVFLKGAKNRGQFNTDENVNMMQSAGDAAVGGMSEADLIARARSLAEANTPSDEMSKRQMMSRFLIPFGLDLMSRSPTGIKNLDIICLLDISSCLLYTSPSPRDRTRSRMPSSA